MGILHGRWKLVYTSNTATLMLLNAIQSFPLVRSGSNLDPELPAAPSVRLQPPFGLSGGESPEQQRGGGGTLLSVEALWKEEGSCSIYGIASVSTLNPKPL